MVTSIARVPSGLVEEEDFEFFLVRRKVRKKISKETARELLFESAFVWWLVDKDTYQWLATRSVHTETTMIQDKE